MTESGRSRRSALGAGSVGVAGGLFAAGASLLGPRAAYAQAAGDSLLRTVLDRGHLIVGTGSTNAPWHFEDDQGQLTGMDIAMARILARACSTISPRSSSCCRTRPRASRTSRPARSTSPSSS